MKTTTRHLQRGNTEYATVLIVHSGHRSALAGAKTEQNQTKPNLRAPKSMVIAVTRSRR
ncbi:MAG: hypothetical protein ACM3X1_06410 [Ignavibacteriales bacterium]